MKTMMKPKQFLRGFVILACLFTCSFCLAQPQREDDLWAVQKNGKFGFIDHTGKIVIPFQFDHADGFYEGLARVGLKHKNYFIDTAGHVLFEAPYDVISNFHEGLCPVNIGQKTIPNLGLISDPGKWGYIDRTGKMVIPMKFTRAETFAEGLAAVKMGDQGAFIDHDAKVVFEASLDATLGFREGIVGVLYKGALSYYDRTGKKISPPLKYGPASNSFSEGLVPVTLGEKTGFMDKTGKIIIEPQFVQAQDFREGLAPVRIHFEETTWCRPSPGGSRKGFTNKWGFIDKTGKIVISAQYDDVQPFSDGWAAVNSCDEGFWIDKTGKKISLGDFTYVSNFTPNGLSLVNLMTKDGLRWGLIDKSGKMIWGPVDRW